MALLGIPQVPSSSMQLFHFFTITILKSSLTCLLCTHIHYYYTKILLYLPNISMLFKAETRQPKTEVKNMKFSGSFVASLVLVVVLPLAHGNPIVPALIIFGDSSVDVGNNNNLVTVVKANFPPYGRDFVTHRPTGRFCNGKLATDFVAEFLGFTPYPPAYLSPEATGDILLTGANFASGASGYFEGTPRLYTTVSLTQQLNYYRDYQTKVVDMVGRDKANNIFTCGIHLLSAGSSDYIQNYYVNPALNTLYTPNQFSDILIGSYTNFIQNLYLLGARRIGVENLPPLGCLPAAMTLFGGGSNECVARLNGDATIFNNKLSSASELLKNQLPGLQLVVFDIYQPLLDMIKKPTDKGLSEARKACCGTGTIEASVLCNARSVGTCSNATSYVFWDGFHTTEAANNVLATTLLTQGFPLIS